MGWGRGSPVLIPRHIYLAMFQLPDAPASAEIGLPQFNRRRRRVHGSVTGFLQQPQALPRWGAGDVIYKFYNHIHPLTHQG